MKVPRVLSIAAFTACLSLAVVGCGNDNENRVSLPSSTTSDTTASASPSPSPSTPGTILGYTPKTDDERAILQQYDAFNEALGVIQTYSSLEKRDQLLRPMVEAKYIGALIQGYDQSDQRKELEKGKKESHIESLIVKGKRAELTDCADYTKVELYQDGKFVTPTEGDAKVPLFTIFSKGADNVWRVTSSKGEGAACQKIIVRALFIITVSSTLALSTSPAYAANPTPSPATPSTPPPASATPTSATPSNGTPAKATRGGVQITAEERAAQAQYEKSVSRESLVRPTALPRCVWVEDRKLYFSTRGVFMFSNETLTTYGFKFSRFDELDDTYYYSQQTRHCLLDGEYQPEHPFKTRTVQIFYDLKGEKPTDIETMKVLNVLIKATKQIKLPLPTPGMAIRHNEAGTPYVYVNSRVWFWTDPKTYKPVTARAQAGGTWVEATATPVGLGFNPRKGDPYFECSGPGDVYDFNKNQIDDRAPSGCYYIYKRITHNRTPVEARLNIRWAITWRSNTAQGTLPDMYSTSPPQHYEIGELHNLVVG